MSVQIRCNCGWNSQVSDFYLGDRVTCPECHARIEVKTPSGVPYGYPAYSTWAKRVKPPVVAPARIRMSPVQRMALARDPHAGNALAFGVASVLLTTTGCGLPIGVVLAIFGLRAASASSKWNVAHRRAGHVNGRIGFGLSLVTLLFSGLIVGVIALSGERTHCHKPPPMPPKVETRPMYQPRSSVPEPSEYRYPTAIPPKPPATVPDPGRRYPVVPKPQPVTPKNDFQRKQAEFSQKVREHRESQRERYSK